MDGETKESKRRKKRKKKKKKSDKVQECASAKLKSKQRRV